MKFNYLESRLKKLPKTEWDDNYESNKRHAPKIAIWTNEDGEEKVCLSSDQVKQN
jgi:hypothetical protein